MIRKFLKLPAFLCILVIKIVYQNGIGRLLPKVCIYEPSCSVYMVHALQTHGLFKGGLLGTWRILRCHPFAKGGWDPVPGYDYDVWLAEQAEKEAKLQQKQQRKQHHNTEKDMQIEKE